MEKAVSRRVTMEVFAKPDRSTPSRKMFLNVNNDYSLILKSDFLDVYF